MTDDTETFANNILKRREFVKITGGAAAMAGLAGCGGSAGSESSDGPTDSNPLTIEVPGGVFEKVMTEQLIDPFTEETGIPTDISTSAQAGDPVQLNSAVKADKAPIDVGGVSPVPRIRGQRLGNWHNYSPDEIERIDQVAEGLAPTTDDGSLVGIGAYGWFVTLVTQTDLLDEPLTSWKVFWDSEYEGGLGMYNRPRGGMIELTAKMFFDGQEMLKSKSGIQKCLNKLKEIKPQTGMFYEGEAKAQQALLDENLVGSRLYHDVTLVQEEEGKPVETAFPDEGAIYEAATWSIVKSSPYKEAAKEFINFSLQPQIQRNISTNLYTTPVLTEEDVDMSKENYEKVWGPGPEEAINLYYPMYIDRTDWLSTKWKETIV